MANQLKIVPANPGLLINLVPVDYVADAIVNLTLMPEVAGRTFHLTAPSTTLPSAAELLEFVRTTASAPVFTASPDTSANARNPIPGAEKKKTKLLQFDYHSFAVYEGKEAVSQEQCRSAAGTIRDELA